MDQRILVINAGSSSFKFAIFTDGGQPEPKLLFKGQMEDLGSPVWEPINPDGTITFRQGHGLRSTQPSLGH